MVEVSIQRGGQLDRMFTESEQRKVRPLYLYSSMTTPDGDRPRGGRSGLTDAESSPWIVPERAEVRVRCKQVFYRAD